VINGRVVHVPDLAIDAQLAQIEENQLADIATLVQSADSLVSEPTTTDYTTAVPYPEGTTTTSTATPAHHVPPAAAQGHDDLDARVEAYLSADPTTLRVQLLGPVLVSAPGPLEPKRLPTSTELVAFLACRPYGATLQDVDDALWPERTVPRSTRNTVITRARSWAGTTDNDEPRLSRVDSSGRLRLTDVLVDWHLFEQLVARARHRDGVQKIDNLRRALSLIHGKPFEGIQPGRYAWLAGDNLEEHMTAAVIDAAHALAEELLATGEPGAARDVARTAQLVDRHDERPWRDLLRAEAALGRPRKVREHVRDLMQVLDVEVADQLMPETAELIKHLLDSERKVAAG
jgi:DNA-binding SARP family transcriptional activator